MKGFLKAHAKTRSNRNLENPAALALGRAEDAALFVHLDDLAAVIQHADNCAL